MMDIFPIPFSKMSGTGNDFIFIDHRRRFIPQERQADFVRAVCRRMFSVGADGVMLIEDSDQADFKWQFYNSDGSLAEMCGNGSRCAARFAYDRGIVSSRSMRFETLAGIIEAEVLEEHLVRVQLTSPRDYCSSRLVEVDGCNFELSSIDTGVPHAVLFVSQEDIDVKTLGRALRFHPHFAPRGTNVNFVAVRESGEMLVRTYERGVEDETRACGTGAVASAIIAALEGKASAPVVVETSGGDRLTVDFTFNGDKELGQVYLTGPAHCIYTGELTAEALL